MVFPARLPIVTATSYGVWHRELLCAGSALRHSGTSQRNHEG